MKRLISIVLSLGVVGSSVLFGTPAAAETTIVASTINTHFYGVMKTVVSPGFLTRWVTKYSGEKVLAMEQDANFDAGVDTMNGGREPLHPVHIVNLQPLPASVSETPIGVVDYSYSGATKFRTLDFRVNTAAPKTRPGFVKVLVAFAAWTEATNCRNVNLAEYELSLTTTAVAQPSVKIFKSACFPPSVGGDVRMNQSGGRVVMVPKANWKTPGVQEFYLSTGDQFNLAGTNPKLPAKTKAQLGSVLRIDSKSKYSVFASGLRNPQGMALVKFSGKTQLFETEHAPRGGDELNIMIKGRNYGWPDASYGTAYSPNDLKNKLGIEGSSGVAPLPIFAWLPSIGTSEIVQNSGAAFAKWWTASKRYPGSDIFVAGMQSKTLYRIRYEAGAVRYVEPIVVGERIRSLTQMANGVLVAGTDNGQIMMLEPYSTWSTELGTFQHRS